MLELINLPGQRIKSYLVDKPKPLKNRICKGCKKIFNPKKSHQKYCVLACYRNHIPKFDLVSHFVSYVNYKDLSSTKSFKLFPIRARNSQSINLKVCKQTYSNCTMC